MRVLSKPSAAALCVGVADSNLSITENGAIGYQTTGKERDNTESSLQSQSSLPRGIFAKRFNEKTFLFEPVATGKGRCHPYTSHYEEVANTNVEAVFDLILQTAVAHRLTQQELPHTVLILSDMEFDACVDSGDSSPTIRQKPIKKLFDTLARRYATHGYLLPRLAFWNICSRTGTIPIRENELGAALVSGFSPTALKAERYQAVEEALQS